MERTSYVKLVKKEIYVFIHDLKYWGTWKKNVSPVVKKIGVFLSLCFYYMHLPLRRRQWSLVWRLEYIVLNLCNSWRQKVTPFHCRQHYRTLYIVHEEKFMYFLSFFWCPDFSLLSFSCISRFVYYALIYTWRFLLFLPLASFFGRYQYLTYP